MVDMGRPRFHGGSGTRRPIKDGLCWTLDQVVVANHQTIMERKKNYNLKHWCVEWSCPYICTFSYMVFISYRGDSLIRIFSEWEFPRFGF
jgi:hypothetical protein